MSPENILSHCPDVFWYADRHAGADASTQHNESNQGGRSFSLVGEEEVRILCEAQLKTLEEEVTMVRRDLSKSQDRTTTLDVDVARLTVKDSKLKNEVTKINTDVDEATSSFVRNQGPIIQALLYKILRSNAFGNYVNRCGMALTLVVSTDAVELISLDFPNLDIKKDIYRTMRKLGGLQVGTWPRR